MGAILNFDARSVPPAEILEPVPAGWYNVKIVESEMKPTSSGRGAYLALTLQILDGQFANRKLFDRLNLENENATAKEIAWRTFSSICYATGVIQVQNTDQVHGIPLQCRVTIRPAGPGSDGKMYDAQNEVKNYRKIESTQPTMPPGAFGAAFQPPGTPTAPPQPAFPQAAPPPMPPSFAPPVVPQHPAPVPAMPPVPTPPSFAGNAQPGAAAPSPVPPWAQPK